MKNKPIKQENTLGQVLKLFTSQKGDTKRSCKEKLYFDAFGIVNDKFYNKDIKRSVLISSLDSYTLAQKHDITMEHGLLGENILIDYNPYHLPIGTKLQIGEVLLEITQECTLCKSLTKIDNKLPKILKNDRGVFTKVIHSGFISKNDYITILPID